MESTKHDRSTNKRQIRYHHEPPTDELVGLERTAPQQLFGDGLDAQTLVDAREWNSSQRASAISGELDVTEIGRKHMHADHTNADFFRKGAYTTTVRDDIRRFSSSSTGPSSKRPKRKRPGGRITARQSRSSSHPHSGQRGWLERRTTLTILSTTIIIGIGITLLIVFFR